MKMVVVASKNPVKLRVAQMAFLAVFPNESFRFIPVAVQSFVPKQPLNEETLFGALNRLNLSVREYPDADFWVSQEGGLVEDGLGLYNRAWIVIADSNGRVAQSSTASFELPREVARLVRKGKELGEANDIFWKTTNSKEGKSGLFFMTDGLIDRERYYLDTAIIALSQLKNHHLYDWD